LQAACRRFAKVGQGEKRFSTSKFPEYLRVLDALDAGVSQRKIAKALKPVAYDRDIKNAEKNIRDAIKAAKAFRDGGYILLARDPEKTGD
jgi:hypothetical protein